MDEKEKTCKNCKYFVLYYTNQRGLFQPMTFGHCICEKVSANSKKRIFCNHVCEHWEENQSKKQAKLNSIEQALCRMANDLNHYIQTLKEEELNIHNQP